MPNSPKVLIVEDEHLIALDMKQTLVSNGYEVVEIANEPDTALAYLAVEKPDVALLDLNLGDGHTSFEVALRLKELGCPFVFVSGYSRSTFDLPENLADTPWIAKPFREKQLLCELEQFA
ncbi:response regulator [Sulfitobacter sp. HNIBRBA3233]|uniref:response regulator n=1 Tax=Sulfitobacter marinivivus TaxID=3158558 RepID=UPI0032E02B78